MAAAAACMEWSTKNLQKPSTFSSKKLKLASSFIFQHPFDFRGASCIKKCFPG